MRVNVFQSVAKVLNTYDGALHPQPTTLPQQRLSPPHRSPNTSCHRCPLPSPLPHPTPPHPTDLSSPPYIESLSSSLASTFAQHLDPLDANTFCLMKLCHRRATATVFVRRYRAVAMKMWILGLLLHLDRPWMTRM